MENKIRLLLIEDSEDDAILLYHAIRRGGLHSDMVRVQTEDELLEMLSQREWDIIITDNELPVFNAERAIAIIKNNTPDIPIIIVSGNISEEQIVRFMKAGASDYISKSNFTRLAPSIEREIREYKTRLERNSAKKELKETQLYVQGLIDATTDSAMILYPDGTVLSANSFFAEKFGIHKNSIIGKNIFDLLAPFVNSNNKIEDYKARIKEKTAFTTLDLIDGIWLEHSVYPILDERNEIKNIVVFSKDITETKLAQEDLALQKAFLQKLFDDAPIAIAIIDNNWVINKINVAFEQMFEYSPKEILGRTIGDYIIPENSRNEAKIIRNKLSIGESVFTETERVTKSGKIKDVVFAGKPIFVNNNKIAIYAMYVDISDRKKAEKEIIELNAVLERKVEERTYDLNTTLASLQESNTELSILNDAFATESQRLLILNDKLAVSEYNLKETIAAKDRFISIIGHDLKNPLQGIVLASDLLLNYFDKMTTEQIRNEHKKMFESANNLSILLSDLLEWSLAQSDKIMFYPEYVNISALVHQVIDLLSISADKKEINLITNIPEGQLVYSDKNMITTVLRNIISNAIKFSHSGSEVVIDFKTDIDKIILSICDNGVGISEENINKLFDVTESFSSEGTAQEKGSGLGLIICKEFIDKHNGKLGVESTPGIGSKFYFELPINHSFK